MALQIRRGTLAELQTITPANGELIWTTDTEQLFAGDGLTQGGILVNGSGNFGTINVTNTATVGSLATAGNIDGAEGAVASMTGFRAGWYGGTAGFAFKSDTTTGMFGYGNGDLRIRSSGTNVIQISTTTAQFDKDILLNAVSLKFGTSTISAGSFNDIVINVGDSAVRLNGDQGVIVGDGGGSSQIDVNQITGLSGGEVNIASVLKMGDGSGSGYITSKGNQSIILQTNNQTYEVANFSTSTNYLRSSNFELRDNDYNLQAQISNNGSTHYGNYHNFGNTNAQAQINSQGTGNLLLTAGSDSSNTGGLTLQSGENGSVQVFGPGSRNIATFNTGTITTVAQIRSDFDAQLLTYEAGNSQGLVVKNYNNSNGSIVETSLAMRHRGSKVTPAAVQQYDTVRRDTAMPYTGAWADSSVFGFLSGSYYDGYSYGPEFKSVVSQDFSQAPLYWNHLEGYFQLQSYHAPDAYHSTSTEQVSHTWELTGNKIISLNGEVGGGWGGLDSTVQITPTLANGTEVPFVFKASDGSLTAPKLVVTNTATVGVLAATNTSTVALLTIGKNNSRVTFPGQTTYANSMLLANDNTSGPIIFTTKGASTNRSLMITRNADLVFHNGGQISSQSNGGIGISAMSTATVSVVSMSAGFQSIAARQVEGIRLSTYNGVDQWFTTMNTATGSWSFPGDITVTNTATAQSLVSTTTTVTGMMTLPIYAGAALTAITGVVGQVAVVSDGGGKMAFWDTSASRWSYVHDNSAV